MKKVVIIGSSAAGMMAAIAAAERDKDTQVTVLSNDATAYRRPGIPALISGYISEPAEVGIFSQVTLTRYNIKLLSPTEVTGIDAKAKVITFKSEGKENQIEFDSAVIATGGHPTIPFLHTVAPRGALAGPRQPPASRWQLRAGHAKDRSLQLRAVVRSPDCGWPRRRSHRDRRKAG